MCVCEGRDCILEVLVCSRIEGERHTEGFAFFFQAEDGIRDLVRSRGLGDVYKRQDLGPKMEKELQKAKVEIEKAKAEIKEYKEFVNGLCLLYTSDAADERSSVDLGGRRIIKKKKTQILDE